MAEKQTKADVDYSKGHPRAHCGICEHYRNHTCSLVAGAIDPAYWCKLFRRAKGVRRYAA